MSDPFDDPAWKRYAKRVQKELVPMMKDSRVTMALATGSEPDPKMAIEIGYMILLDKPIITVVTPGAKVSNKLAMISDAIVEADLDDPNAAGRIAEAIQRIAPSD